MPRLIARIALPAVLALSAPAFAEGVALPPGFDGDYVPDGAACTQQHAISVKDGVMIGPEFAITVTDLIEHPTDPRQVEATFLNEAGGGGMDRRGCDDPFRRWAGAELCLSGRR